MFSNKYEDIVNNSVREIIRHENLIKWQESMDNTISNKITSQDTRAKLLNWIENRITSETSNDKKLGELFGGFFVKIIESNFSYIMDNAVKSILKGLTNNQQVISEVAISTTKENLNFFELMGYNMLGGDDIIASVIGNLINDKFPDFIESKRGELNQVLENFIDNRICGSTVESLNLSFQHEEVLEVIDKFINNKDNIQRLNDRIIKITDSLFNWMTDIKVSEYLSVLSINKIEDLIVMFENELNFTGEQLENSIAEKEELLVNEYTKLIWNISEI